MFVLKKKPYGIYEPVVISKHRTKENAEKKRDEAEERHKMFLSIGGFRTDGTIFYIEEE